MRASRGYRSRSTPRKLSRGAQATTTCHPRSSLRNAHHRLLAATQHGLPTGHRSHPVATTRHGKLSHSRSRRCTQRRCAHNVINGHSSGSRRTCATSARTPWLTILATNAALSRPMSHALRHFFNATSATDLRSHRLLTRARPRKSSRSPVVSCPEKYYY